MMIIGNDGDINGVQEISRARAKHNLLTRDKSIIANRDSTIRTTNKNSRKIVEK